MDMIYRIRWAPSKSSIWILFRNDEFVQSEGEFKNSSCWSCQSCLSFQNEIDRGSDTCRAVTAVFSCHLCVSWLSSSYKTANSSVFFVLRMKLLLSLRCSSNGEQVVSGSVFFSRDSNRLADENVFPWAQSEGVNRPQLEWPQPGNSIDLWLTVALNGSVFRPDPKS